MTASEERLPTSNVEAEKYVLSSMMWAGLAVEEVGEILAPADFFRPVHQDLYTAMVVMHACGDPIDPVTLRAYLDRNRIRHNPTYLADLYGIPGVVPESAPFHARLVWECSVRRHIRESGTRMAQDADELYIPPEELIARAQAQLASLMDRSVPDDNAAMPTSAFRADTSRRTTPVIPGLLDHQDRVVVVATEGGGKTTLAYQVAYALGAGVHPFTFGQITPGKALIMDLELPHGILARKLGKLEEVASKSPGWDPANVAIWSRPAGIDITSVRDTFRLTDVIRREQPDLVLVGPVYKMIKKQQESEHLHYLITEWADMIRERYGCAFWIEAHAPLAGAGAKRLLRPRDSGVWSMWPEFGLALARSKTPGELVLDRFRGDREEGRTWPDKVNRHRGFGVQWPWEATYPAGTFMDPLDGAQ